MDATPVRDVPTFGIERARVEALLTEQKGANETNYGALVEALWKFSEKPMRAMPSL